MNILLGRKIIDDGGVILPPSEEFSLDLESILGKKLLVQAMSGAGKSWLIRRILEQVFPHVQIIVLDSEGDFRTLREKFPFVLVGGDQGDVPVSVELAKPLAHKLLELRTSAIIDISELSVGRKENERCDFVSEFLTALLRSPQKLWHPTLVVLDEAQEFAPERFSSSSTEAVIQMAGQARKRGFGLLLATNRLSELSKSAAAHCKNKLIGGSMGIDAQKAAFELGLPPKDRALFQDLDDGQFYAIGPAFPRGVHLIKVGNVETTHPSPSGRELTSVPPPQNEVKEALAELSALQLPTEEQEDSPLGYDCGTHLAELDRLLGIVRETESKLKISTDDVLTLQNKVEELGITNDALRDDMQTKLAATKRFKEAFADFMGVTSTPPGEGTYGAFDEEAFLEKVIARVGTNGQTIQVTPPEALRKKYLTAAVEKFYDKASKLEDKPRRALEVLLSSPVYWSMSNITKAVGAGTGGQQQQDWRNAIKSLMDLGFVMKGGQGRGEYKASIEKGVREELSVHSPTDQEVEQVVAHVLARVVTG